MNNTTDFAQFGETRFTGLLDVAIDLTRLNEPGYWVVIGSFEGDWLLLKFKDKSNAAKDFTGTWQGVDIDAWKSSMSKVQYQEAVLALKEHIALGDVYQANICRVLKAEIKETGYDITGLVSLLNTNNPAPYGGVVSVNKTSHQRLTKDIAIASASPELFLKRNGEHISSSPIKGTGRTSADLTEKDRAENVMIVDLVRNDLSQICQTGSVKVPILLEEQLHPGLVHLVSTVQGVLNKQVSWKDIFQATFPPGSVSGAPKISALKLIKELETVNRGPYCGAIGWINTNDDTAEIAVGIRTFWKDNKHLLFGTGAGITWGSEAEAEWDETELKCAKLFEIAANHL